MNNSNYLAGVYINLFSFCEDKKANPGGTVVFCANNQSFQHNTTIKVFIENRFIGLLNIFSNSVSEFKINYNLKKELNPGHYNYKIEIRSEEETGSTEDIFGELIITEGCCEILFINYFEVFAN